jgi:hypothetical protein
MLSRTTLAVTLAAFAVTGCAAYLKMMTPKPRIVDNPLVSHQPLEVRAKASLGTLSEKDCNVWPFEDTTTVNVTAQQICVEITKHVEQSPGWNGEPTADRSKSVPVNADGTDGGYISAEKKRASKVAQCFNRGFNAQVGVWAFQYKGCTPNNNVVSSATKSLTVNHESWQFSTAQASPGGAAPVGAPPS